MSAILRNALIWLLFSVISAQAQGVRDTGTLIVRSDAQPGVETVHDRTSLSRMRQREFTTSTIWTERPVTFTGVALLDLIRESGFQGPTVRAYAINDYVIDIPVDSLTEDAPIVAYLIDGEPFGVRNRGPFWIVYPYDADPAFRTEAVYARSIWQLRALVMSAP